MKQFLVFFLVFLQVSSLNANLQVTPRMPIANAVSNQWVNSISAGGATTLSQPAFTNISGSVAASQMPALTGDVTTSAGAVATTLATVNSNTGTFGDSTHVAQVTVNAKGLITAVSSVAVSGGSPTAPKVTVYTSSSGTHTMTGSPLYVHVRMAGGGGGGGGSGSAPGTDATTGGNTTFGSSFLTAAGGGPGFNGAFAGSGTGGAATINSGATGIGIAGANGSYIPVSGVSALYTGPGANGGQSALGGGGVGVHEQAGGAAKTNSGSGGAGGGLNGGSGEFQGNGGGAGAYIDVIITSPSGSYGYAVGGAGSAGGAGTGGLAGGAGAAGLIEVTEYYQ